MTTQQTGTQNPKEQGPTPPFPEQEQPYPGRESEMQPQPDYGEQSYRGSGRLEGKKAIVTGGDSGIGRAVALAFAREGTDVLISYLNEEPDAQETIRGVEEAGQQAIAMPGDIGNEAHCQQIVERAVQEFGGLDILVNNAAYQMNRQGIQAITAEELERTFRTNMFAIFYLCKAALPPDAVGRSDHQHYLRRGVPAEAEPARLRHHQGSDRHLHQSAGGGGVAAGYSRQRRGTGAGVDTVDSSNDAGAANGPIRPAGTDGAAGRAGAGLRLPRLSGVELHRRRSHRRDRGQAPRLASEGGANDGRA